MTKRERQRQIAEIMENFNFENVYKMMTAVAWEHDDKPVTMQGLKDLAARLLKEVRLDSELTSGGLSALCGKYNGNWFLSLEFVGEAYTVEDE